MFVGIGKLMNEKTPSPAQRSSGVEDPDHDHGFAPKFLPHAVRERWAILTVAVAGLTLIVGFFGEKFFSLPSSVALAFYVLSYLAGGYDVAREALPALLRGKFDIDLLMIAAAAGAAVLGEWAEGAFLLFLFSLGHAGEHYAMDRARNAVGTLGKLMPRTAFAKRESGLEEVPVEALVIDEIVVVKPGERVPVDGIIVAGESSIDQSAITGESVPVNRKPGDEVFAGTINQDNALDVRMTRLARDNTLRKTKSSASPLLSRNSRAIRSRRPSWRRRERGRSIFLRPAILKILRVKGSRPGWRRSMSSSVLCAPLREIPPRKKISPSLKPSPGWKPMGRPLSSFVAGGNSSVSSPLLTSRGLSSRK